jgi:hypothetical protein
MKIRRQLVRTTESTKTKFYRHEITLPPELVAEMGWTYGTELVATKVRGGVMLRQKKP